MIYVGKGQLQKMTIHCQGGYPRESCGILAGKDKKVTKVYQMINTSETPETCYFMDPREQLKVFKKMRKAGLEMLGVYHSHVNTQAYPSAKDLELAFYPEVVHLIISLQESDQPVVRGFRIVENKISEEELKIDK